MLFVFIMYLLFISCLSLMVNDFEVDGPLFKIPLIHLGLGNYLKVAGAMTE